MNETSQSTELPTPENDNNKQLITQIIQDVEEINPGLLEGIENKEEIITSIFSAISTIEINHSEEHHSGPLPAPKTLREYNEIIPDGAERITTVFENQSNHRMSLETKVVGRQTFQSLLGQIFGFLIALICLLIGVYLIEKGHEAAGITLFAIDIVGLAAVFVIGKRMQKDSLNENK